MNFPWRDGNRVELLINGEDYFPSLFEAVGEAQEEILLETFIIFEDEVGLQLQEVLMAAARRGVQVDMIVDGYGTAELSRDYIARLNEAGVNVHLFDPRPRLMGMRTNLFRRLHRKIVVIDQQVAFIGGINYGEDHLAGRGGMAKQDYAVKLQGPVVEDLRAASHALLNQTEVEVPGRRERCARHRSLAAAATGSAADDGTDASVAASVRLVLRDNDEATNHIETQYLRAIRGAQRRLVIANAYFFPGYRMLRELRNAARRGVKVELILQGLPDMPVVRQCSRLLYDYLLREGVEIHEYCQRPLHGKVALMDEEWATVGSSNLDPLSLSLNLEGNVMIRDRAFNQHLYEHLHSLAGGECKRITRQYARRGYWWRAPLIVLSFHFLRHFPAIAGWFPAHSPRLKSLEASPPPAVSPLGLSRRQS